MKKRLSINDIAKIANVSKSTISRYFNNGYVKQETRQKIAKIVEQNHYEPNTFARLKASESRIIGVIAPCLDSTVTSQVLMAIDEKLKEENYTSLIINTNHNVEEELRNMDHLSRMKVDGIILNATIVSSEHEELAKNLDIPIVFVAQKFNEGVSIVNDDYAAGKKMGEYIGEKAFKKVAYIGIDESDKAIGIFRKNGILDGLAEQGIDNPNVIFSDFSFTRSYEVVNELLNHQIPEVIICSTTRQVLATYKCIRDHNLQIPMDISVVGFGGQDIADLLVPSLTTIQFCTQETGYTSVKALLALLNKETVEATQVIPYHFIEGDSVR